MAEEVKTETEVKENKVKKALTSDRAVFWYRFVLWVLFSIGIPAVYINYNYGLFSKVSGVSLSGWAILVALFVMVFLIIFLKYLLKSPTYAFYKQVLRGVIKLLLPLAFVIFCLYVSKETINKLINVLCCCFICWAVAICINPMPKWTYDQTKGQSSDIINYALDQREQKKVNNKSK